MSRQQPTHGLQRGSDEPTRSRMFEGLFGWMFRNLPEAVFEKGDLIELGLRMTSEAPAVDENREDPDDSGIPAGHTYLGQFIAHDLTFDPTSSLQHDNDPDALVDFRTPRFDLDSVYGRGPVDQPYLYEENDLRLLLGETLQNAHAQDVPRTRLGRAIIGDPRNDENVIIAQLHSIFLRFHNRMAAQNQRETFEEIQRRVRWHYQWVVLYDYLRRIVNEKTYKQVLPHYDRRQESNPFKDPPQLRHYRVRNDPYLPIEFSAAAFRFGHSMVRRRYRLNRDDDVGVGGPFEILGHDEDPTLDLRGFRRFRRDWGIEWDLFFEGVSQDQPARGKGRVQRAFKIDTTLSDPLRRLPATLARNGQEPLRLLAQRNLIRGLRMRLPSGQTIARAMGQKPIPDQELWVGPDKTPITKVSERFANNAPLWFYILAEAQHPDYGSGQLGPVGGRIVMEVVVGLMLLDGYSFLRQDPLWKPDLKYDFDMAQFIIQALQEKPPQGEQLQLL
jgi:Animal haem peroxidase